jgi:hypothetical protein
LLHRCYIRRAPILVCLLLTGCIHAKIEQSRDVEAVIGADEGVALVSKPQQEGVGAESDFLDCLETQLFGQSAHKLDPGESSSQAGRHFRMVSHRAFADALYPWLEPSTVIGDSDFARALLARPEVRERILKTGVRYLVLLQGSTDVLSQSGSISCVIGPGVGGCFGVAFWKKKSDYEAVMWDLQRGISLGTVGTDISGNSVFIGAVVPLPFIVPVQHTACTRMAAELDRFLLGKDP